MLFTPFSRQQYPQFQAFVEGLPIFPHPRPVSQTDLLLTSFIHKSYACDYVGDYAHNERLEFLGDGILGAIINKLLYLAYGQLPESQLTLYKIKLVREETLAEVAMDLGIDKLVLLGHGEERQGGRTKKSVLSDTLEAFLGYLYLDQPMDVVESFVRLYIYPKLALTTAPICKSYKSLLQEYIQKEYKVLPLYQTDAAATDTTGNVTNYRASVFQETHLLGTGFGQNKKTAEDQAAKEAWEQIMAQKK